MTQELQTRSRDAVLVEDATLLRMMGLPVLESVPSQGAPYELTDPFILVHEGRFRLSDMAGKDTKHPHRGFAKIGYIRRASASTCHSPGPGGSTERTSISWGSPRWQRWRLGADQPGAMR